MRTMSLPVLSFLILALVGHTVADRLHCHQLYGGNNVTAIVVADPGNFSETGEIKYLLDNLRHPQLVNTERSMCARAYKGKVMGQHVVLILSGIGPTAAALCMYDLLACADMVKEVVYMGTSGWSPQQGGLLNPEDCSRTNQASKVTRIGDVCVTPFAVNWVCKKADWAAQCASFPNLCGRPGEQLGPNQPDLYGKCVFTNPGHGSYTLADELLGAAQWAKEKGLLPKRNDRVQAWEAKYWHTMSTSTSMNVSITQDYVPEAWSYRSCVESDSQFFFSGVPWELTARDYTALTINMALNASLTARDVVAVSAMEGVGLAELMTRFNALPTTKRAIPWAIVRSNADWLHNIIGQASPGVWVYMEHIPDDFNATYKYAIATGSAVVLSMLQQRCNLHSMQRDVVSRRMLQDVGSTSSCKFVIDYS